MKKILYYAFFAGILFFGCQSDDENNDPETTITSFSGTIQYENGEPVTGGELIIAGNQSTLFGGVAREGAILTIDDGTFEVTLETEEEVTSYSILIDLLENVFTFAEGLQCLPGNCRDFLPGDTYELSVIVPCSPDDCGR